MKKSIKIICFVLCLVFVCISFSGCVFREFLATLGFDTHDYQGEKIIKTYEADSEKASRLLEAVKILTVNSAEYPEFSGTKEAAEKCRDAALNYMYNSYYSKYTGNPEIMEKAQKAYPQMRFSVVIPAEDFANFFYKYFGGKEKVASESGDMFEYLPLADIYVTAVQPKACDIILKTVKLEESASTYRLTFTASQKENGKENTYFALIVKRADDSFYFKELTSVKNEKNS